jgi:tripartite-type tricarboxylate transporter receptor subunit TctC
MVHVPYQGSAPAMNDLVAGHVKVMFDNLSSALPHIQAGRLRALGVTGPQRDALTPDVPAIAETLPGFDVTVWVGLLGPRQTPEAAVRRLADGVRATLGRPEIAARLRGFGGTPLAATPEAFAALVRADIAKWREVVRRSGLRSN